MLRRHLDGHLCRFSEGVVGRIETVGVNPLADAGLSLWCERKDKSDECCELIASSTWHFKLEASHPFACKVLMSNSIT